MEKRFDEQVAIITGAGNGMGKEHAKLLASRGAAVVVNDLSQNAATVVEEIIAAGGKAVASHDDVSTVEGANSLINTAIKSFGRLDILVSNAGIINSTNFEDMAVENFEKVMRINAFGAFYVTQAAFKIFKEQKYGRIVLVSSSSAYLSQPFISHYAASKGAVLGLGKSIAAEGVEHGILVNMIMPGAFTAMSGNQANEEARKQSEKMMPARLVSPVVAWLAHKDNTYNGEIIEVASGRAAKNFIGSTKGYWNEDLSIEQLFEHQNKIFNTDGFAELTDTTVLAEWMTIKNTGWQKV